MVWYGGMRINARRRISEAQFWRDACIAGGQVTFGVVAAIWFVQPFSEKQVIVLLLNGMITIAFILTGLHFSKKL